MVTNEEWKRRWPNFEQWEFECPCCGKFIFNEELLDRCQVIRNKLGQPVNVTSGTRCARHNKAVGGVKNSQHMLGKAADLTSWGYEGPALAWIAGQDPWIVEGGLGVYLTFIHLDVREYSARWGLKWRKS